MNLLIFGTLLAFDAGWLYLMWVVSYVFINPLISRIRQVAEHGAVPDLYSSDPRENTRTVRAGWLARVFVPHGVNYHLEHHMLASVPCYRLKLLHQLLTEKGFYDGVSFPTGYIDLLLKVTIPSATAAAA